MPGRRPKRGEYVGTTARFGAFEELQNRSTCGKVAAGIALLSVGLVSIGLGRVVHGIVVSDNMDSAMALLTFWLVAGLSIVVVIAFIVTNFGMNSAKVSSTLRISGIMVCALAGCTFLQTTWKSTLIASIDQPVVDSLANIVMRELHYLIYVIPPPAAGADNIHVLTNSPYDLLITIMAGQLTLFSYQFTSMVQMIHVMTIEHLSSIRAGICLAMSIVVTGLVAADIGTIASAWDKPTDYRMKVVLIVLFLQVAFATFQLACVIVWLRYAKGGFLDALQSAHTVMAGVVFATVAVSAGYALYSELSRDPMFGMILDHECLLVETFDCLSFMAHVRAIKFRRMTEVFVVLLITIHTVEYFQTGISMINKSTSNSEVPIRLRRIGRN